MGKYAFYSQLKTYYFENWLNITWNFMTYKKVLF